jgi:hypothetical protein
MKVLARTISLRLRMELGPVAIAIFGGCAPHSNNQIGLQETRERRGRWSSVEKLAVAWCHRDRPAIQYEILRQTAR